MDGTAAKIKLTRPLGENLPYGWIILALSHHLRRRGHGRYGRSLDIRLLNFEMELGPNAQDIAETVCETVSFLSYSKQLIFRHCRLLCQIPMSERYIFGWLNSLSIEWKGRWSFLAGEKNEGLYVFNEVGSYFCSLLRQNMCIWREIL